MIVKDEEPVVERALEAASLFADEIIVADTGSRDLTGEIARRYTEQVYHYPWKSDFSAARNYSYSRASGDFIMWLDADDVIAEAGAQKLRRLKERDLDAVDVVFLPYTGDRDEVNVFNNSSLLRDRLIRRSLESRWEYPVHEGIPIKKEYRALYREDIPVYHRKVRVNDPGRNLRIFEAMKSKGIPFTGFNQAYYCRELSDAGRHGEAVAVYAAMQENARPDDLFYALFFVIASLKALRRYGQLRELLLDFAGRFTPNEMVCCELGTCYMREQQPEQAEPWLIRATEYPVDLRDLRLHFEAYHEFIPCLKLSKLRMQRGDSEGGRRYYERAAAVYPNNPAVTLNALYFRRNLC
jgi:glycosyltransferase involved in cell wall biosynthesis